MARADGRAADLVRLRDWCVAILDALAGLGATTASLFREGITAAFEGGNLRGLKAAAKDLEEWARSLTPEQQRAVDQALQARFGRGLDDEARDDAAALDRVVRRGRINTQREYRLLLRRVNAVHADPEHRREVDALNALLAAYDDR